MKELKELKKPKIKIKLSKTETKMVLNYLKSSQNIVAKLISRVENVHKMANEVYEKGDKKKAFELRYKANQFSVMTSSMINYQTGTQDMLSHLTGVNLPEGYFVKSIKKALKKIE